METLETKIEKSGLQLDENQSEERSFDLYVDVTPLYSGPNNPNNGPNNFNPMGGASVCGNNFGNNHALQSPWQIQTQTINASLGQDFLNNSTFSYMGDNSLIGKDNQNYGLQNEKPFQYGYDLPETGTQLHLHGPDQNTISQGHIVPYGHQPGQRPLAELNGYDASMASLIAEILNFKKFP